MLRVLSAVFALCLPLPATAREAGSEGTICTLTHAQDGAAVRLTFDPTVPLYTIAVAGPDPWPVAPEFSMTFEGARPNTIRTQRHVLTPDLGTLRVSDRGFGNVLDGLEFNTLARATSGAVTVAISLEGAAPAVRAFRACGQTPSV